LIAFCAEAHAQEACPWLTKGTAAALLGGDVGVQVRVSKGEGVCDFQRETSGRSNARMPEDGLRLRIAVGHLMPKECATGERLTGIGEDSVLCGMDVAGARQEMIRGRVRDKYFLFTLIAAAGSPADTSWLRKTLEQGAEEVAGNLL
jgi:hypothetical protein